MYLCVRFLESRVHNVSVARTQIREVLVPKYVPGCHAMPGCGRSCVAGLGAYLVV